jgi:hypothetical protein
MSYSKNSAWLQHRGVLGACMLPEGILKGAIYNISNGNVSHSGSFIDTLCPLCGKHDMKQDEMQPGNIGNGNFHFRICSVKCGSTGRRFELERDYPNLYLMI